MELGRLRWKDSSDTPPEEKCRVVLVGLQSNPFSQKLRLKCRRPPVAGRVRGLDGGPASNTRPYIRCLGMLATVAKDGASPWTDMTEDDRGLLALSLGLVYETQTVPSFVAMENV